MSNDIKCSICNNQISFFRYRAMRQWNMQGYLCSDCYSKRLTEYYSPEYIPTKEDNSYNKDAK